MTTLEDESDSEATMAHAAWHRATKDLPTKAAKIRALDAIGVPRAEIARFLDVRYQQVRNVLTREKPVHGGMAEQATPFQDDDTKARVMPDGSVRIPPSLAKKLGVVPGQTLVAAPEDGGLWIASHEAGIAHAQAIIDRFIPKDVSLVDELFKMRREEVEREEAEFRERYMPKPA